VRRIAVPALVALIVACEPLTAGAVRATSPTFFKNAGVSCVASDATGGSPPYVQCWIRVAHKWKTAAMAATGETVAKSGVSGPPKGKYRQMPKKLVRASFECDVVHLGVACVSLFRPADGFIVTPSAVRTT
jgi:hypothetical protein